MIVSFFFTSAPEDSAEGSRSGPRASLRSDEVRAGDEAPVKQGADSNAAGSDPLPFNSAGAVRYRTGPARTLYDSLYTMVEKSIDAVFREASL
ncbi:MAG: hypothetical protein NUW01_00500 [Gemmatimonadaceae bacterium]|nr:hypothetical protein [Gemmatimonadaceae bacterium]